MVPTSNQRWLFRVSHDNYNVSWLLLSFSRDKVGCTVDAWMICWSCSFFHVWIGEALNIDLTDFINTLYAILLPLSFHNAQPSPTGPSMPNSSVLDTLFRALNLIFSPRTSGASAPPWRSAAFSKRLLTASMQWPSVAVLRTLDFVSGLVAKDPKLEAMLSTEDRIFNGVYRPDVDDPQLCHPFESSFWELHTLHRRHWDTRVREEAGKLLAFNSSS